MSLLLSWRYVFVLSRIRSGRWEGIYSTFPCRKRLNVRDRRTGTRSEFGFRQGAVLALNFNNIKLPYSICIDWGPKWIENRRNSENYYINPVNVILCPGLQLASQSSQVVKCWSWVVIKRNGPKYISEYLRPTVIHYKRHDQILWILWGDIRGCIWCTCAAPFEKMPYLDINVTTCHTIDLACERRVSLNFIQVVGFQPCLRTQPMQWAAFVSLGVSLVLREHAPFPHSLLVSGMSQRQTAARSAYLPCYRVTIF